MKNLFERILKAVELLENNSQTAFAKKIGCQQSTFNGYLNENGQRKIRLTLLADILRTYPQISRNWLFFGEGEMTEEAPSRETVSPLTAVLPLRTAEVPPPTTAAPPSRTVLNGGSEAASGDIEVELVRLREKLAAAQEANARLAETNGRLSEELIRLNAERRKLEERLAWEKMPDKIALSPLTVRGGTSEEH